MRLLNIGCGDVHADGWINMDIQASDGVLGHDVARGLPFEDEEFHGIYCSHLLEHLSKVQAQALLGECLRVLRPGGALRVVVPDLEAIVRLYLNRLERSLAEEPGAAQEYDWLMLELFDQMVREVPGGMMRDYWEQDPLPASDFVTRRVGSELTRFRERFLGGHVPPRSVSTKEGQGLDERDKAVGAFRRSGEIHRWMYDRFSLGRLLVKAGFMGVRVVKADESAIHGFGQYHLDTCSDGSVRKPDSLFMEAARPGTGR